DRDPFPSNGFRRFWAAGAVSSLGTYITLLALQTLVVVDLGGGATTVGWVNSARWLPYLVLGLVVGALVDRRPRRPVLIASDLAQAVLLAVIPVTWAVGGLSLPVVLGVVMAYGTVSLVEGAASMSFLPRLVDRRDLQRAHVRVDGADAVAQNAGPALGGLLVTLVGAPFAVLADAATHLFSAVMTATVRVDEPAVARGGARRHLRREVAEGLRWIYRGSSLGRLAVSTHVWFVGNAVIGVVVAPFALLWLGLSPFQLGLAGSAAGVGALLGTAASTPGGRRWGTGAAVVAGHAVSAVGAVVMLLAGIGTSGWAAWAVLALGQGLHGAAIGFTNSHEMAYRQTITPDALQGRTNTTLRSLNRAVIVVVAPLAGALADAAGVRTAFAVAAVAFAVACLLLAASPFRRVRLDDSHAG
ncbi:MAG: MFS transporter, partial [Lapillicoccus sp.]